MVTGTALMDPTFLIIVAVLLVAIVGGRFLFRRHKNKRWLAMAEGIGFTAVPERVTGRQPLPTLSGRYGEHGVALYHVVRGSGKNKSTWTAVEFMTRRTRPDYELKLTIEGVADWFQKRFGGQDIQVGDAAFDRRFRIQSNEEATTVRLLQDPSVRQALLEHKRFGALTVRSARITYLEQGFSTDREHFEALFPLLSRVTYAVEATVPSGAPEPPVL